MPEHKRFTTWSEFCAVVRYEWSVRRAWRGRAAAARGLWWTFVRRYAFETCTCGRPVGQHIGETFWRAPDALWEDVVGGPHGVLCPRCFTERAEAKGLRLHWEAVADA